MSTNNFKRSPVFESAFTGIKNFFYGIISFFKDLLIGVIFPIITILLFILSAPLILFILCILGPGMLFKAFQHFREYQDRSVFYDNLPLDAREFENLSVSEGVRKANSKLCGNSSGFFISFLASNKDRAPDYNTIDDALVHEFIQVGYKKIHVIRSRVFDEKKKTIICFHGNTGTNFNFVLPLLALCKDYNVIIPEVKGYGVMADTKTKRLPRTSEIRSYLDALSHGLFNDKIYPINPNKTIVVGYSLGSKFASSFVNQSEKNKRVKFFHNVVFITSFYSILSSILGFLFGDLYANTKNYKLFSFLFKIIEIVIGFFMSSFSNWSEEEVVGIKSPITILHGLADSTIAYSNSYFLAEKLAKKRNLNNPKGSDNKGIKLMLSVKNDHMDICDLFCDDYDAILEDAPKKGEQEFGFYVEDIKGRMTYYPAVVKKDRMIVDGMPTSKAAEIGFKTRSVFDKPLVDNSPEQTSSFISEKAIQQYTKLLQI